MRDIRYSLLVIKGMCKYYDSTDDSIHVADVHEVVKVGTAKAAIKAIRKIFADKYVIIAFDVEPVKETHVIPCEEVIRMIENGGK